MSIFIKTFPRDQMSHQTLYHYRIIIYTEVKTGTAEGGPTKEAVPMGNGVKAATIAACKPPILIPPTTRGPYPASLK